MNSNTPKKGKGTSKNPNSNPTQVNQVSSNVSTVGAIANTEKKAGCGGLFQPTQWSAEVKAVVIVVFVGTIVAALFSKETLNTLSRPLRTREIEFKADLMYSGSGYSDTDLFNKFGSDPSNVSVGDVAMSVDGKTAEHYAMLFLSFYVDAIPQDAEIETAELKLPCSVEGDVSQLPYLYIRSMPYGEYDNKNFWKYTSAGSLSVFSHKAVAKGANIAEDCKVENTWEVFDEKSIANLPNAISLNLRDGTPIQFVLWFSPELDRFGTNSMGSVNNGRTDAIFIRQPPVFYIRYITQSIFS